MVRTKRNFNTLMKVCLVCLSVIFLTACNNRTWTFGEVWGENTDVKIYAPEEGSEWEVNTSIEIYSLVSAPNGVQSLTLLINGQENREDLFAHPTFTRGSITQQWIPTRPGTYTLQTILKDNKDEALSEIVTINVIEPTHQTLTIAGDRTPTESHTPSPTITATVSVTPTPESEKPQATADQDLNCRRGPSTLYETIWSFMNGQTAAITGRISGGGWLLIERGDGNGECWVAQGYVTISGELEQAPIVTPPPLPPTYTPTATERPYQSCSDYFDMTTCNQDPMGFGSCFWDTGLNVCKSN